MVANEFALVVSLSESAYNLHMVKSFFVGLFILCLVAISVAASIGGMVYLKQEQFALRSPSPGTVVQTAPSDVVHFDMAAETSNIPGPENVQAINDKPSVISVSWKMDKQTYPTEPGVPTENGTVSGYRIYRDGYWYRDIDASSTRFVDDGLTGDLYTYEISVLTFNNKLEGLRSTPVSVAVKSVASAPKVAFSKPSIDSYLAEGDSITEGQRALKGHGWVDQVEQFLSKGNSDFKLSNKGVTGAVSEQVKGQIGADLIELKPDLVTVGVGLNELFATGSARGNFSMGGYRDNLQKIVKTAAPSSSRLVVLVGISRYKGCCGETTGLSKLDVWNKVVRDVAASEGAVYVDVNRAITANGGEALIDDVLHPSQKGHDVIAQVMIDEIKKRLVL